MSQTLRRGKKKKKKKKGREADLRKQDEPNTS